MLFLILRKTSKGPVFTMGKYKGEIALIVTAIFWGYGFVATADAIKTLTPYQLIFARFLLASVLFAVIFFKKILRIKPSLWKKGSVVGALLFLGFVLQTVGIKYTTPSKNAFLTSVNVIIVPIISMFIFKRKTDRNEVLGAITALLGIGILTLRTDGSVNIGDILTLLCAVAFAFQIFYTAIFMKGEDPIEMTIVQIFTCTVLSGIAFFMEGAPMVTPDKGAVLSILFLAFISTGLSTVLQMVGQKYTTETRASIFMSTECLWGTLFSVMVAGEAVTLRMLLGGLFIFAGVILSEIKPFGTGKISAA